MSNLIKSTKKRLSIMDRGQVLVVVALAIVGIVAVSGLALDVGVMFIEGARLRRAVDSAALAAALQYRQGFHLSDLDNSAIDFLRLNGINDPDAIVQVCINPAPSPTDPDYIHHDPDLCPQSGQPPRKFVRVVATGTVRLAFLPVIGIDSAPIAAEATSETASVDVVLVIDRSDSMTWTAPPPNPPNPPDPMRDPSICNYAVNPDASYQGYCRPFDDVKKAAVFFVEQLYFPYDRVAVVTFDKGSDVVMGFSNDPAAIISGIKGLTVYEGEGIYPNGNPSRWYDPTGFYYGLDCPQRDPLLQALYPDYPSPAPCTTTNIGAGLNRAGLEFNNSTTSRQVSLWVVILLTDGVANAGYDSNEQYFCPANTWDYFDIPPKCNDGDPNSRHTPVSSSEYDAEDYAYDSADFVGALGQNALIFTIGLGDKVKQHSIVKDEFGVDHDFGPIGELYLQYAAGENVGFGTYTFAPDGPALIKVFGDIAKNIATRLTH